MTTPPQAPRGPLSAEERRSAEAYPYVATEELLALDDALRAALQSVRSGDEAFEQIQFERDTSMDERDSARTALLDLAEALEEIQKWRLTDAYASACAISRHAPLLAQLRAWKERKDG